MPKPSATERAARITSRGTERAAWIAAGAVLATAVFVAIFSLWDSPDTQAKTEALERVRYNERVLKEILRRIDEDISGLDDKADAARWRRVRDGVERAFAARNRALLNGSGLAEKLLTKRRLRELMLVAQALYQRLHQGGFAEPAREGSPFLRETAWWIFRKVEAGHRPGGLVRSPPDQRRYSVFLYAYELTQQESRLILEERLGGEDGEVEEHK